MEQVCDNLVTGYKLPGITGVHYDWQIGIAKQNTSVSVFGLSVCLCIWFVCLSVCVFGLFVCAYLVCLIV